MTRYQRETGKRWPDPAKLEAVRQWQAQRVERALIEQARTAKPRRDRLAELSVFVSKVVANGPELAPVEQLALCKLIEGMSEQTQLALQSELLELLSLRPSPTAVVNLSRKIEAMRAKARAGAVMAIAAKGRAGKVWNPFQTAHTQGREAQDVVPSADCSRGEFRNHA